ncbi:hypothetical protein [Calothrix sp. PCC 6303]|uniref:hypothetical protein n=1 Tax=Calothrix sp. PCC 6303 TaxID=1170562 RepID=UPI0002A02A68|nr:hypothetical protein [Calothrix sp. PCC 6303]AFZ03667.1 hypothetical protein Cal6303_4768 [Calothrix sp. PCC 6303]
MKSKTTILAMLGCLTIVINSDQNILASTQTKLSQVPSSWTRTVPNIPNSISVNIRQDMAKRLNLKLADVRIVKTDKGTFDSCLSLPLPNEGCNAVGLPGWVVTVVGGKQRWLYHAFVPEVKHNNFRVNWLESLPKDIKQKVINNSTSLSAQQGGKFKVTSVEPRVWKSNCLELSTTGKRCNSTKTLGWLITLKNDKPGFMEPSQWVYRSDLDGKILELDLVASVGNLPKKTTIDILSDAAKRSQTQRNAWKVDQIQALQWSSYRGGDGPSQPIQGAAPVMINAFGWKVQVSSLGQKWVYYVTRNGFDLDAFKSIPPTLIDAAIKAAVAQTGKSPNTFNVHWVDQVTWDDTCLGITINKPACAKTPVPGWRINVMGLIQQGGASSVLFTFHSRLDGDVRFNGSNPWLPPPVTNPGMR